MKGSNAFLGSFHVKEEEKAEQGFNGNEHYHLNQHLLSFKDNLFTRTDSRSRSLYHGGDLWNRREIRLWHATALLNDDKLFVYNKEREGSKKVVGVVNIDKSLTEGEFQPEIVLPTSMEAVRICYSPSNNALVIVGNKNVVQRWEMDWSGVPVLRKEYSHHHDTKDACMLDEHHLLLAVWGDGVKKIDLRTMSASETPFPDLKEEV